jgi:uncharacterized membrane protein
MREAMLIGETGVRSIVAVSSSIFAQVVASIFVVIVGVSRSL